MMKLSTRRRRIAIGTITRERPKMLQNLLRSYARLELPVNAEICFVIVENSATPSLGAQLNTFANSISNASVTYLVEPVRGIASARNRVLRHAIEHDFDLLSFADDDEEVAPGWLVGLLGEMDANRLDMVGSPVRLAPLTFPASWWQQRIWSAVNEANRSAEQRAIQLKAQGRADIIRIATGSWLGNLDFFRKTGLRFDDGLGLSGGEDWELYAEARRLGARTGWTPHAIAWETLPAARLSLGYYYRRSRDHARTTTRQRVTQGSFKACVRLTGSILARLFKISRSLVTVPFTPARSALTIAACLGAVTGIVGGICGKRSRHYQTVEGY